ncbi:hypothetical protein K474DRAFT_1606422, partial [Panus rudis PR-1116 ss-1]
LRHIKSSLPDYMSTWGRVRIADGGDKFRCASNASERSTEDRDASCVRVCMESNFIFTTNTQILVAYGQLQRIIQCDIPDDASWNNLKGKTFLYAAVVPFRTNGRDATKEITTYSTTNAPIILDLRQIENVVGRVYTQNKWSIIDRSDGLARTVFMVEEDAVAEEADEPDDDV